MRRFLGRWARRLFVAVVVVASLLTLFFAVTPQGRTAFHTALFVLQVLDLPYKPQAQFTGQPIREEVRFSQAAGEGVADVYRIPDGKSRAAVLLSLGANAAGRDDEDVINLGNALARAGFVTMFHRSPTMTLRHNIDAREQENLVWGFEYLAGRDYVDPERVGMGGFCVGASFALVAAADPRINERVRFVNAFGPYFDAEQLMLQVASRSSVYQGQRTSWEPDQLTMRVFANELIETLEDDAEAALLTRAYVNNQPLSPAETAGLSANGMVVRALLEGTTPEEAESLFDSLPTAFRSDLAAISPANHVEGLQARLLLLHDRNDRLVPSTESRRLSDAFEERGDIRYTEVLAFEHVRPDSGAGVWRLLKEAAKLYRHMYGIIRIAH